MPKSRIPYPGLLISISVLIVALVGFFFWIRGLLDPDAIKARLVAEISRRIGCASECRHLTVDVFPEPKVVVHDAVVSCGSGPAVTVRSITVLPRIIPLLTGRIEIAEVDLDAPSVKVPVPRTFPTVEGGSPGAASFSFSMAQDRASSFLAILASQTTTATIKIHGGNINFHDGIRPTFSVENLNGQLHYGPDKVGIDLSATSSLWNRFSLKGWMDPGNLSSAGRIKLDGFHPQALLEYFHPSGLWGMGESVINAELSFSGGGPGDFRADFQGSVPALTLTHGSGEFVLKSDRMQGNIQITPGMFHLELTQMRLQDPQTILSGSLHASSTPQHIRLDVEAKDTDVASIRRAALILGGENRRVRKACEIVRGGCMPLVSLTSIADSVDGLFDMGHYVITGDLTRGELYIARPNLRLEDVTGNVIISDNILKGSNLHAQTGTSTGSNGNLSVALSGDDPPFHLDIDIDGSLAELPPVLYRVVKNQDFIRELTLARDIKGTARGKLILGERLEDIDVKVDVKEFSLSGDYKRLSNPFNVKGTAFLLEKYSVSAGSVGGNVGRSTLSDVSVTYSWQNAPHIQVSSNSPTAVHLKEFYPWLISHESLRHALRAFSSAEGTALVDRFDFKGRLFDLSDWQLKAAGRVENLLVNSKFFPGPVRTASGRFEATKDTLSLLDLHLDSADGSLTSTIAFTGYLEDLRKVEATMTGNAGQHALEWIWGLVSLPSEYWMRPPLAVSQASLSWEKSGNIAFKANIAQQGGALKTSLDLLVHSDHLTINRLHIKDQESEATISLALRDDDFDFSLDGAVTKSSMDRLLANNQLLDGRIKGQIKCRILPDDPFSSTIHGKIEVEAFEYLWKLRSGRRIEKAALLLAGREVNVLSSAFEWLEHHVMLNGKIHFSPAEFALDMDVVTDNLDWDELRRLDPALGGRSPDGGEVSFAEGLKFQGVPLQGAIRVKTDIFTCGKLKWGPLAANVVLHGNSMNVGITDANLCGAQTPGKIVLSPGKTLLTVNPTARNADLDAALICFLDKKDFMDGTFSLNGTLTADKLDDGLLKSLDGEIEFTALKGRIYRFEFFTKIFAMLNITEIYRGQFPDTLKEGCPYNTIRANATLKEGKMKLQSEVDGPSLRMVWQGDVDLVANKIKATVLVSPLKTVDTIISHVPIIGGILGGSLLSIPVEVNGDLSDPEIIPLSPSAVGSELVGYMKRTFQIPLKLIQPLR